MSVLFSFLLGCLFFLALIQVINFLSRRKKWNARAQWDLTAGEELHLKSASIASDLAPLFSRLDMSGAKISVVGGDGSYIRSSRRRQMRRMVRSWTKAGAHVTYILHDPSKRTETLFSEFAEQISTSGHAGSLTVVLAPKECRNDESAVLLADYRNHHPTVYVGPSGRALWLEGLHPDNSVFAYNIRYIPPSAVTESANSKATFKKYLEAIEKMEDICQAA
ncbi:MAG: hypothetical protein QNJ16_04855 [Rhodobacter sp.]|nr:hypothetical protein [Rhodobacter sp.]